MAKKAGMACLGFFAVGSILTICVVFALVVYGRASAPENSVQIRIQNNMHGDMSDFWLGSGPGSDRIRDVLFDDGISSFGEIEKGETTRYRTFTNEFRYFGNGDSVVDGKRYFNTTASGRRGKTEYINLAPIQAGDRLPEGKYTFAYFLGDGSDVADLVITKDE